MTHVVVNLHDVDEFIVSMNVDNHLSKWLSRVLKKESVTRRDWLTLSSLVEFDDEHIRRAVDNNEDIYEIIFCDDMKNEIRHVVDWLTELEQRDARLFSKLDRITWKQAVEHSTRWHEALARRAEKLERDGIPFDENCPVVLECDDGLKWVWLKTDKARDDEGRLMGHCVGQGGYDDPDVNCGVFSLRDKYGIPHVTVEMKDDSILQSVMRGNEPTSDKYEEFVKYLHKFMKPKLTLKSRYEENFKKYPLRTTIKYWNGTIERYLYGCLHGGNLPAIERFYGYKAWYREGLIHRSVGPAMIMKDGTKHWFKNGVGHRDGKPASIFSDGTEIWKKDGEVHRIGGPALINKKEGSQSWFENGLKHRLDGPASINVVDGEVEFAWFVHGKLHREDGPAVKEKGAFYWYQNGKLHREGGPAIEDVDGDRHWYRHGKLHRDDGPAIESVRGTREWYQHGELHREGGPAVEQRFGDGRDRNIWYRHGLRHRDDGPAVESLDGVVKEWYVLGIVHRIDGPASIDSRGIEHWYLDGEEISKEEFDEKTQLLTNSTL